jgi:hypothetical protein
VFSVLILTSFEVRHRGYRKASLNKLPLQPISALKADAELIRIQDRKARLQQIYSLPLAQMIRYAEEDESGDVICTLCRGKRFSKDFWADKHFRIVHFAEYCNIKGIWGLRQKTTIPDVRKLVPDMTAKVLPRDWISLEDIESDFPIMSDEEIERHSNITNPPSAENEPYLPGPSMIRRFVVIREGPKSALCLGIHT